MAYKANGVLKLNGVLNFLERAKKVDIKELIIKIWLINLQMVF